jgi:intracellular multiplication protein IcmE
MTDQNDFDLDNQDEFESDVPAQGASLKDAWDNNPLMKIGAIVLAVAVLAGGYLTFFAGDDVENVSRVISTRTDNVKVTVGGKEEIDAEYTKALAAENQRDLDRAKQRDGSTMPTPLSGASSDEISLPAPPTAAAEDPLEEWRRALDGTRVAQDSALPSQADLPPEAPLTAIQRPAAPAPQAKMDPDAAKRLSEQMRVIIAAQMPGPARMLKATEVESEYMALQKEIEAAKNRDDSSRGADGARGLDAMAGAEVIVPAGNIAYGQLLNELNSDIRGPVLVHVLSGPFTGGRALGQFTMQDEYLVLTFRGIVKEAVYYKINGIALDEKTTLTGHQSDVDRHYFTRIILPAAAEFISGYASAVAETGTTTTTTAGGGVVQDNPEPDATEEVYKGVESAADTVSEILKEGSQRPITVKLHKGTTMGILFMESVTTEDAE